MSLEAHHRFILDTMQRNQDIARNIINELEAENARLKAEVERLTQNTDKLCKHGDLEIERLKAEVERLRASSFVTAVPVEQYERLRKAGDALEQEVIGCYFEQDDPADSESLRAWRAAKEGKQS